MVRVEEAIKGLAPVVMVRDMIEPLQRDVQKIAVSVQLLTDSDLELKQMHKDLMVERGEQEKELHRLEVERLQEELEEQRRVNTEAERRRGVIVFIKDKATPTVTILVLLATLIAALYGLVLWLQRHYR